MRLSLVGSEMCIRDSSVLGGVTTTTKGLHLAFLASEWTSADLLPLCPSIPQDLGTLLSYGEDFTSSAPAPALQQVEPLRAHEVQQGSGIYHGRGLLPSFPSTETLILTPARGLPPHHWGVHPLTRKELLQAYHLSLLPI